MNATAANLVERVLPPESGLRQWVLTFPFSWRRRLAQDGALLGRLTRIAVETVLVFYAARAEKEGGPEAKSGAVTAVQRTSSDLRLNPHLHRIALDGTRGARRLTHCGPAGGAWPDTAEAARFPSGSPSPHSSLSSSKVRSRPLRRRYLSMRRTRRSSTSVPERTIGDRIGV
jgi:hypothetical protein